MDISIRIETNRATERQMKNMYDKLIERILYSGELDSPLDDDIGISFRLIMRSSFDQSMKRDSPKLIGFHIAIDTEYLEDALSIFKELYEMIYFDSDDGNRFDISGVRLDAPNPD